MATRPQQSQHTIQTEKEVYACLILRMWQVDGAEQPAVEWRSEVEHIQSGGHWSFASLAELEQFLNRWLHDLAGGEAVDPPADKSSDF